METQVSGPSRNSCATGLQSPRRSNTFRASEPLGDEGKLDCDCGISVSAQQSREKEKLSNPVAWKIDDSSLFCEGGCNRWFHVWCAFLLHTHSDPPDKDMLGRCMGCAKYSFLRHAFAQRGLRYHGARDIRLPAQFICLDCRLRGSHDWDIIAGNIHADIIARYKDLALFRCAAACHSYQNCVLLSRRAVKICEVHQPASASLFREHTGQFNLIRPPRYFHFQLKGVKLRWLVSF